MTRLLALRRDFIARQTSIDDELLIGPDMVLPDLPEPSPAAKVILSLFAETEPEEIEIIFGPSRLLH